MSVNMEKETSSIASSGAPSLKKLSSNPVSGKVPESEAFEKTKSFVKIQSLRPNKVKSFIKSIFYREETPLEVEKSVDPCLVQGIKDERMNYIWTLLVIVSIVTYITYISYHWLLRRIGVIGKDSLLQQSLHFIISYLYKYECYY